MREKGTAELTLTGFLVLLQLEPGRARTQEAAPGVGAAVRAAAIAVRALIHV